MNTCPPKEELEGLLTGTLSETASRKLEEHLQGCRACERAVDHLGSEENWVWPGSRAALERGFILSPSGGAPGNEEGDRAFRDGADIPAPPGYANLVELSRGGMGVVYLARQVLLNRVVVLKTINTESNLPREQLLTRLRREIAALAELEHPNIVQVHDAFEHLGVPYLVLEWVKGESLALRLCTERPPWRVEPVAELIATLAGAVHHAHSRNVFHHDLKPHNILFTENGVPKVMDFGLAESAARPTESGTLLPLGTPGYVSPEKSAGAENPYSPAADIHALGVILRELLARPSPAPPEVTPTGKGLPRGLAAILRKCLREQPGEHFTSAEVLSTALRQFLRTRRRRKRAGWAAGFTALLGLSVLMGWVSWKASQSVPLVETSPTIGPIQGAKEPLGADFPAERFTVKVWKKKAQAELLEKIPAVYTHHLGFRAFTKLPPNREYALMYVQPKTPLEVVAGGQSPSDGTIQYPSPQKKGGQTFEGPGVYLLLLLVFKEGTSGQRAAEALQVPAWESVPDRGHWHFDGETYFCFDPQGEVLRTKAPKAFQDLCESARRIPQVEEVWAVAFVVVEYAR